MIHIVPNQRTADDVAPVGGSAMSIVSTTTVLPYLVSKTARRTRRVRMWMVTLPVDLVAVLMPLAWNARYWKGTGFAAIFTIAIFAAGGLYRARRHLSILD